MADDESDILQRLKAFQASGGVLTEELRLLIEISEQLRDLTDRLGRRVAERPIPEYRSRIDRIITAMGAAYDDFDERVDEILECEDALARVT